MIIVLPDKRTQEITGESCTVDSILERFGVNPLEVIVSVNGKISPEGTVVGNGDKIRIIRIAHGG